jgi:hypothetical protein
VRPALKPGLLPVWRDRDTLQIGIDSRRAVALTGMAGAASVIGLLDGSRDRAQVIQAAANQGIPADVAERVLSLLAVAGALDDFPAGTLRLLSQPLRSRLAAELAAASLASGDGDGGARTLARRLSAQVRIHGGGRVADGIAALLATSGIGRVLTDGRNKGRDDGRNDGGRDGRCDGSDDRDREGSDDRVCDGSDDRVCDGSDDRDEHGGQGAGDQDGEERRDGPGPPRPAVRPDLAILVGRQRLELRAGLMRAQVPHLAASADEAIGVVGPLVIPGRTACLRCLDLTRADRDPAWPLILAQLDGRDAVPLACDAPLAAAVAAQAAAQALAFIDRAAAAVTDGTLELVLPGWQWRRRTWPRHSDCSCGCYTF